MKVIILDKNVRNKFWTYFSVVSGILSFILLFNIVTDEYKVYLNYFGYIAFILLIIFYLILWYRANNLTDINFDIDGSNVNIKCGDLFLENGLKTIPFNEYFDTEVDDKIISNKS